MPRPARRLPEPRAMVVAAQPEAAEAGADALRAGGSAVDAVVAAAFVQGVVDPLMCGLAGFGVLHAYDPRTGEHLLLDGQGGCPAACTEGMWADRIVGETRDGFGFVLRGFVNECGHQAVSVPGILATLGEAQARLGRLPWATLFPMAEGLAEEGFPIRPHVYAMMTADERAYGRMDIGDKLGVTPDGRRIYLGSDGSLPKPGQRIRNPDLATTLRQVAGAGPDTLYRGEFGRRVVADMEANGGLLSLADLDAYRPERQDPLLVPYRGYVLATNPPPGGGIVVGQMLRVLERFDLAALGHNSPGYIRVVAEAMKRAIRDRDAQVGDPRFVSVPLVRLLSDAYADECAAEIRCGEVAVVPRLGLGEAKDTTHVSCVDEDGMVASLTHTLGIPSGVIPPGTGTMLNGAMSVFDPRPGRAGSIAPGKRRVSSMCPSVLFEGGGPGVGRPVITLGAPGGNWITLAVLQVLLNVVDWGMGMQEAISAPRFVAPSNTIDISNRIPRETERELQAMGYAVKRSHMSYAFAGVHGISMWEGSLEGGADPQRDGMAFPVV